MNPFGLKWNAEPRHDWPGGKYVGATCTKCGVSGFNHPKRAPSYCWPHYEEAMRDAEWRQASRLAEMTAEYGPVTARPPVKPTWP